LADVGMRNLKIMI